MSSRGGFTFPCMAVVLFPWTPALAGLRGLEWREPRKLLLLAWLVFGFVFFSASSNKLPGYILPLVPAATALAGIGLASNWVRFAMPASTALLGAVPVVATVLPEAITSGLRNSVAEGIWWPGVLLALAGGWGSGGAGPAESKGSI